jgi:hypothetical protein
MLLVLFAILVGFEGTGNCSVVFLLGFVVIDLVHYKLLTVMHL